MAARDRTTKQKQTARTTAAKKAPAPAGIAPRAPGERRCWLVKTEPDVFSFDDLMNAPDRTTCWDGVRNYQARNFMRDGMRVGDEVFVYHSNAEPPSLVGLARVAREAYPDPTQFDPASDYYDPTSKLEEPRWLMVDVQAVRPLPRALPLPELREAEGLDGLELVRRGSRLSVQPVSDEHRARLLELAGERQAG